MASVYPGALDSFATNKANATATTTDHPNHHNDLADAVNKIEAELGIDPAGSHATVLARFNALSPLGTKPTVDTPDDDFTAGTLDGKWTAVVGSSSTVALLSTSALTIYDLTTRPGYLLTQVGRDGSAKSVQLRQDFTLPDGTSILVKVYPGLPIDGYTGTASVQWVIGISLNSDDASYFAGTAGQKLSIYLAPAATTFLGSMIETTDGTTNYSNQASTENHAVILRIARAGTVYYPMYSVNGGFTWVTLGPGYNLGAAKDNVWLVDDNAAAHTGLTPITAWDWMRQGTNDLIPW